MQNVVYLPTKNPKKQHREREKKEIFRNGDWGGGICAHLPIWMLILRLSHCCLLSYFSPPCPLPTVGAHAIVSIWRAVSLQLLKQPLASKKPGYLLSNTFGLIKYSPAVPFWKYDSLEKEQGDYRKARKMKKDITAHLLPSVILQGYMYRMYGIKIFHLVASELCFLCEEMFPSSSHKKSTTFSHLIGFS